MLEYRVKVLILLRGAANSSHICKHYLFVCSFSNRLLYFTFRKMFLHIIRSTSAFSSTYSAYSRTSSPRTTQWILEIDPSIDSQIDNFVRKLVRISITFFFVCYFYKKIGQINVDPHTTVQHLLHCI